MSSKYNYKTAQFLVYILFFAFDVGGSGVVVVTADVVAIFIAANLCLCGEKKKTLF